MEAKQTSLIDLLERIPQGARLVVEHDQFSSSSHPVGRLCHEAAAALRAALAQQDEPVEPVAKVELMTTGGNAGLATRIVEIDDHLRERLRPGQLLYTAPPQRKPLAEWQINDLMADIDPEDVCSWSFRQGVYAAEKHHGVRP